MYKRSKIMKKRCKSPSHSLGPIGQSTLLWQRDSDNRKELIYATCTSFLQVLLRS